MFSGEKIHQPVTADEHTNVEKQSDPYRQEHHMIDETNIPFTGDLRENSLRYHGGWEFHQMKHLIRHIINRNLRHPQERADHQFINVHINLRGQDRNKQGQALLIGRSQFPYRHQG